MRERLWRFAIKIILAIASTFCALFLLEGLIRIVSPQNTGSVQFTYDPVLGDIPVPNQTGFGRIPGVNYYTWHNNSLGMRGGEVSFATSGRRRILMLGDSMTYGMQVNDAETFSSVLQRWSDSYEVLNAGNVGKGTDYELHFYKVFGYRFSPDIAFLFFVKNDFTDNLRQEYYTLASEGTLVKKDIRNVLSAKKEFLQHLPFYNWLVEHSHLANLIKRNMIALVFKLRYHQNSLVITYDANNYVNKDSYAITEKLVNSLRDSLARDGRTLVVFYTPIAEDVSIYREREEFSMEEKAIQEIAASGNMPFVSLTPPLARSRYSIEELFVSGEGHWTQPAHEIVGDYLFEYLKQSQPWLLK